MEAVGQDVPASLLELAAKGGGKNFDKRKGARSSGGRGGGGGGGGGGRGMQRGGLGFSEGKSAPAYKQVRPGMRRLFSVRQRAELLHWDGAV